MGLCTVLIALVSLKQEQTYIFYTSGGWSIDDRADDPPQSFQEKYKIETSIKKRPASIISLRSISLCVNKHKSLNSSPWWNGKVVKGGQGPLYFHFLFCFHVWGLNTLMGFTHQLFESPASTDLEDLNVLVYLQLSLRNAQSQYRPVDSTKSSNTSVIFGLSFISEGLFFVDEVDCFSLRSTIFV